MNSLLPQKNVCISSYCVRILDKYLLYAPGRPGAPLAALVNRAAIRAIQAGRPLPGELSAWVRPPAQPGPLPGAPRTGPLTAPFFLGLIPTRGCNLACRYCNFDAPKLNSPRMPLVVAREAIDGYIGLLQAARSSTLEVQFFGGEPFYAWETVFFAVEYARLRARELGMQTRFEVITNGVFSSERCRWIADHFDAVVLSLDGPPDLHEWQRPAVDQKGYARIVLDNACTLSAGPCALSLRCCVTEQGVSRMVEIAEYFAHTLAPEGVCFEMLVPSPSSQAAGLQPPDPYDFTRGYLAASKALAAHDIDTIISTVNLGAYQSSFCPVGKDALVVSPDGSVDACYLLREDWEKNGLDLRLGQSTGSGFVFEPGAVQRARDLTGQQKSACRDCLCRFHCAGGCHVRRCAGTPGRNNAEVCIHTRLITIANLLLGLGQAELLDDWLQDQSALESVALSPSDRLADLEELQ